MTDPTPSSCAAEQAARPKTTSTHIPLSDIAIAPENARACEAADEDIPGLAETIRAVGVLVPILARAGSKRGEKPAMALDGRRRVLALQRLLAEGAVGEDYPVPVIFFEGKIGQAAAVVVANDERVAIHVADVITAIGRLRKRRCSTAEIAKALAYEEVEVRRLMALSDLHPAAIAALRQDRIDLQTARLMARLHNRALQKSLAEQAMHGYGSIAYVVRQHLNVNRCDASDPQVKLFGVERYAAAGGRVESDLFGELPDRLLDPDVLAQGWRDRMSGVVERFAADGVAVILANSQAYDAPDDHARLFSLYLGNASDATKAAAKAAEDAFHEAVIAYREIDPASDEAILGLYRVLKAQADSVLTRSSGTAYDAVALYPERAFGAGIEIFTRLQPNAEEPEADGDDTVDGAAEGSSVLGGGRIAAVEVPRIEVAIDGRSHRLLETQTDVATRGLIRDVADSPVAAIAILTAQLFKAVVLQSEHGENASAVQVRATPYRCPDAPQIPTLDGEVYARLEERRAQYMASGLRPIPWVSQMTMGEQTHLLAELVAVSLNVRESKTYAIRRNARVEAGEIAELIGSDIAQHWTPDAGYLAVHGKQQLIALLGEMGVDDPRATSLKKAELVVFTVEAAAERGFAPKVLSWSDPGRTLAPSDDPRPDDAEADSADAVEDASAPEVCGEAAIAPVAA